ncbi:MAG TPA: hypothetical protein VI895_01895 [Bdellovibrionota bacterium]|nr:hypothetical protein [Bdellovibrionota bacterium]
MRVTLSRVVCILLVSSCSDSNDGSTPTPTPTPTEPVTFSTIQSEIFTPSCTQSTCHDSSAGGGLDLTSAAVSYAQLINVPAQQVNAAARGKVRVVPGDPVNSFLVQKLDSTLEPDEGEVMPRNTSGLANSRIDQIRTWINDSAPNN